MVYSERLYPALGTQLALGLSYPMVFLAALPFGQSTALVAALLGGTLVMLAGNLTAPKIIVGTELAAGRFRLPLTVLAKTTELAEAEFNHLIGPGANPAAQLMIRGDVRRGVRIDIADKNDPTPFVVLSTRNAQGLVAAIDANRPKL